MAADAAIQLLLNNLVSLTTQEVKLIFGVEKAREDLSRNFRKIQAVLQDAELNPPKNRADRDWLINLQDAMFEIEDILDECNTHFSMVDHLPAKSTCCGFMKRTPFLRKIGMRMEAAIRTLDAIAKEHANHQRIDSCESQPSNTDAAARETGSLLNETEPVIGREEEKELIVGILVNQVKDNQQISVLPIIGVGGLGKTTFAQIVYNDPRVAQHFEKRMWVCVSDNFVVKTLINAIIKSGGGSASDDDSLDSLQHRLQGLLIQKRYLLVLDDVWSDEVEKWSQLKNALSCSAAGSSIIVTTRLGNVSEIMRTLPAHKLKGLTEEQCWMLLKQRAFGSDEEGPYRNLEKIGRQIAKKCAGVPLAAKALGGLLRFRRRTESEWMHIKDSEIWNLPDETAIMSTLRLSYHHLPLHLRQCFVYCAVFSKDFQITKEDLIHRWMAHGYISSKGTLDVEDVGQQICNELLVRSLFHNYITVTGVTLTNKVTMHDLVHDLAESIMKSKVSGAQLEMMQESKSDWKIREVDLHERYVAFPKSTQTGMDISFVLEKYNRLRVLNASHQKMEQLPSTIGNLRHLRMLNLSMNGFRILPEPICGLWNLQVLDLFGCSKLELICKMPGQLKNLRHLLLEGCFNLRETPSNIRESTCLRRLSKFIVGCNKGNRLDELERLNLAGDLEISHLDRVENVIDAQRANLSEKRNLHKLTLYWNREKNNLSDLKGKDMDDMVLEALQPHSNIKEFHIHGFSGRHFPTWMKMSNMVDVRIFSWENVINLSQLEEMPCLESLRLQNLKSLEYIGHGGNGISIYFPALKNLTLYELPNLKGLLEVEAGQKICPQLDFLFVNVCPILELPTLTSLRRFHLTTNSFSSKSHLKTNPFQHESLKQFSNLKALGLFSLVEQCLPMEWLHDTPTLEELEIRTCSNLAEISGEVTPLHSLKKIDLMGLPKMVCVPEAIRYLPSLEVLNFTGLQNLTSLPDWLGDLTSLRSLLIDACRKLKSLPNSIQRMKSLQSLSIDRCPDLERRCKMNTGEEWHKIARIPRVRIGPQDPVFPPLPVIRLYRRA